MNPNDILPRTKGGHGFLEEEKVHLVFKHNLEILWQRRHVFYSIFGSNTPPQSFWIFLLCSPCSLETASDCTAPKPRTVSNVVAPLGLCHSPEQTTTHQNSAHDKRFIPQGCVIWSQPHYPRLSLLTFSVTTTIGLAPNFSSSASSLVHTIWRSYNCRNCQSYITCPK